MTVNVGKKYIILKWFAAALLFVALILTGITWYFSVKLKPIVTAELKELVLKTTENLYQVDFSAVNVNVLTGISSLSDVTITPDTAVYRQLIALKHAPNNLYKIKLKKLAVRNFHPFRLWRDKKLNIDLLLFDNPSIEMTNRQFDYNDEKLPHPIKSPYDYIEKYLKELRIKTVDFKNASFKYIDNNTPDQPKIDYVDSLNITLKDWLIDRHSANDKSRLYLLKDVIINLNAYSYATSDSLYFVKFNRLDFAASSGKLDVKNFSLEPRESEHQFGSTLGYAKDRYNIQISSIGFTGINLPLYILKQELFAREMTLADGTLAVLNNNTLPKKVVNKIGSYPHQLLQKANAKLTIAKLNLDNIDISYSEFGQEGKGKGVIMFEETRGTITNVTNLEKVIAKDSLAVAALTSRVMGSGKLDVNFKFNLAAKDGAFSYAGVLEDMEGRAFNRITKPLGLVKVNSGHIDKLAFDVKANDEVAKGTVSFAYKDLSLAVLKRVKGEDRLVKQGLISFLANALVINSSNPSVDGKFVTATVDYKRVPTASFFNFIWKTLFQGVKYSVGFTPAKEKKIKEQIAKFGKIKADRQARQKRRAERLKMRK
ncbi:hypothetical protein [Pedobacter hiemivivus]|uniref:DUF748 domain-containing protein n=1 Tax=Pedobacter hiemivivus TaxID=2530454 RepID=A0A4R0NG43_9SPHI|nr:hypothetical protein [Pedobacter hiemivivus]TCC97664.1 hypothetical protein EZ444_07040 [Pedobacter hiemivivus]